MSWPSSSSAEFEQQQKQLNEDVEEQSEKGKQILRSLEELRTTQRELINTYTMDAIDKWKVLVGHMEAAVSRGPAREAQSKSNILGSVLQNTQEKVGALRIQAESLETCAAELYAHSTQLGERAKQLGNDVEDCVAKVHTDSAKLIVVEKRVLNQVQMNKRQMNNARDKAYKDWSKASQWETAKNVTTFIPGVNIFAYPLTSYWYNYHSTNHIASTQRVRVHENEGEGLETLLESTHTQLKEIYGLHRRLTAIKMSVRKTTSDAGQIKLAARAVGQWCAITASSALDTIQALRSVCITLKGAGAILRVQDIGNMLHALVRYIQHIDSSEEGVYSSSIRREMCGLERRLRELRIAKLAESNERKVRGLRSDMEEL